jgi:hypothetical protein
MLNMTLTTPALLFPAISLLLLAYTNRFLVLAQVIRQLSRESSEERTEAILRQIAGLEKRITLIKVMQIVGVTSFLCCTGSMFALFVSRILIGEILFGISLLCLSASLLISLYEVAISTNALTIELDDVKRRKRGETTRE